MSPLHVRTRVCMCMDTDVSDEMSGTARLSHVVTQS
jgi:hypothetical protein